MANETSTDGGRGAVAFLGTGLLGSGFVRALLRQGSAVHVWNRTASKAQPLAGYGATVFDDPAQAVRGVARVHLALSDDAAVDDVLERARSGLSTGVAIVDHTTTSPGGAAERVQRWAERGIVFQHAPVFMGPGNALESTGTMLASGERSRFDALTPALAKMTGKLVYVGASPQRAAEMKLLGNLFLMFVTSGLADMLALAKACGISPTEAVSLFDHFNPGTTLGARAKRLIDADFIHPSWELSMARKDARLMLEEAGRHGRSLAVLPAIASEMDRWIARGHAGEDWMVIARDSV